MLYEELLLSGYSLPKTTAAHDLMKYLGCKSVLAPALGLFFFTVYTPMEP